VKLLRLRLHNYRGVVDSEVRFESKGVTIVEGPNEAGKSSLAEAIGILFDHLDSTLKREVKALKPVHRDEGAEIEADIETGPYSFTYFKRFHKRPETRLRIERPQPENLTGREAHERADAILRETIDVALWKALRIKQGAEVACPALAGQTRLSAALDAAAGSSQAGEREESLFEAARAEYSRYFTEGGQERKDIKERQEQLEAEKQKLDGIENQLRVLESDIGRSAQLRREISQLAEDEKRLAKSLEEHAAKLATLTRLESDVDAAQARSSEAAAKGRSASEDVSRRAQLVEGVAVRTKVHAELLAGIELSDPERAQAARDFESAQDRAERTKFAHTSAASLLALRQRDRTFRHEELDLQQMLERKSRIEHAQQEIVEAEKILAGPEVTDRTLEEIRVAGVEVEKARAGLEIGSPRLSITAQCTIAPLYDGAPVPLRTGQTKEWVVERSVIVAIPGIADLKVSAGASAADLRGVLDKAQEVLAKRLVAARVQDLASAAAVRDARREATRTAKEKRKVVTENLRDLSIEELEAKVEALRLRVGTYPGQRASDALLPVDLAEAKQLEAAETDEAARLKRDWDAASVQLDAARTRSHKLTVTHAESQASVRHAAQAIQEANEKLAQARVAASDEELESRKRDAEAGANAKARDFEVAKLRLAEASPDEIRALEANARRSATDAHRRSSDAKRDFDLITGRLQVSGEEGLAESRDRAAATCSRLEAELVRTLTRGAAARLLHEALAAARNEAHAAYVAPLREQIEKLGRLVFGSTLRVDLDDSLAITSRTLDGITVPFDSLSGGTREQLSLLARLACAIVVAKEGGAPVILDDTLGYTDAGRLESMGAALARAGESCQVIVLTCMPERYRNVGGARRVSLSSASN